MNILYTMSVLSFLLQCCVFPFCVQGDSNYIKSVMLATLLRNEVVHRRSLSLIRESAESM